MTKAILLVSCPDRKGITATVTNFIYQNNGNILHADQHIDDESNTFFMRVEWDLSGFRINRAKIQASFKPIANKFEMRWHLFFSDQISRVAIFVSKPLHCLYDLLWRYKAGQLNCQISMVMSNHLDAREVTQKFGISFFHFMINPKNKQAQERQQLALLKKEKIGLVVLARYHQILTGKFVKEFENRVINIHHSFLPAFAGKNPYLQAYRKGVKIIGATSHYVTEKLDEGPIIEQDIVRVSHRDSLEELKCKGEDLEKLVLSRAVRWHLEKRVLSFNNKTVIFD